MANVRLYSGEKMPLEMHKVRIVQKLNLRPVEYRHEAMTAAGNNTFLLQNDDVFLDMLTDSGVNAMSDRQQAAMLPPTTATLAAPPTRASRAACTRSSAWTTSCPRTRAAPPRTSSPRSSSTPGSVVPMNYHFTTTKAHIVLNGGSVEELICDAGLEITSDEPFKGNMDIDKLVACIEGHGPRQDRLRAHGAGTNLIGGQPHSLENLAAMREVCDKYGLLLVMDASLLADNLYFIKTREAACRDMSIREISRKMPTCATSCTSRRASSAARAAAASACAPTSCTA